VQTIAQSNGITFNEAKAQLVSEKQPQTEMVTPDQVGDLVGFLCSDSARTITGATISIDGGWTAR
jgi:3-hydroxybutyrate dehydrogenase